MRDETTVYYAWVVAAFAPWMSIPERQVKGAKAKHVAPRAVEVARESLRIDNKTLTILRDASRNYEEIIETKSSLLDDSVNGSPAEIRQQIGLLIRSWGKDWRICMLLALLQEIMAGRDFTGKTNTSFDGLLSDRDSSGARVRPVPSVHSRQRPRRRMRVETHCKWRRDYEGIGGQKRPVDEQGAHGGDECAIVAAGDQQGTGTGRSATAAGRVGLVENQLIHSLPQFVIHHPFCNMPLGNLRQLWQEVSSTDNVSHHSAQSGQLAELFLDGRKPAAGSCLSRGPRGPAFVGR